MRPILTIVCLIAGVTISNAQIISQFSWDSNPVTTADVGPAASSVSSSATSSTGGAGGTNGLNAGLPKLDLNLVIADNTIFNVPGIEVSFDFQRDESTGTFFQRGNSLIIDGCAQLSVDYRVEDGMGGYVTVSSGNAYTIPNDDTFRKYRFYYLPVTGYGALTVDGVTVWSNDGPDNRNMYWTGAGNINIGTAMDGAGSNKAFLDNFIIAEISTGPLPIQLINFEANELDNNTVHILWQTASEVNNDYFSVERSADAEHWENLTRVEGAGNSGKNLNYQVTDHHPLAGISYYRLKQTDYNGEYTYSVVRAVEIKHTGNRQVTIYPNPADNTITIEGDRFELEEINLYDATGKKVDEEFKLQNINDNNLIIDISNLDKGIYYINTKTLSRKIIKN